MKKGIRQLLAESKFEVDKVVPLTEERLSSFLKEVFISRKNKEGEDSIKITETEKTFSVEFRIGGKVFLTGKQGLLDRLFYFNFAKVFYNDKELDWKEKDQLIYKLTLK